VPVTFRHYEVAGFPIHVLKIMCQKIPSPGSCEALCVKSRSQNWNPTSWKSRPTNFQVSVLETTSVKIQAPKLRSQVLKTMSWKPYPKIFQAPKLKSQVLKTMSWNFPGLFGSWKPGVQTLGLQKLRIPCPENHVQKISRFGSWKPTPCTSQNWNLTSWKSCP